MNRISPYSMIQVALPIHFTFPPFAPGIGSADLSAGSCAEEPMNVGNRSDGKVKVLVIGGVGRRLRELLS